MRNAFNKIKNEDFKDILIYLNKFNRIKVFIYIEN